MAGICNAAPQNGDYGAPGAKILVPMDPAHSLISLRMKSTMAGRMPPLGVSIVHTQGTALMDQWINSLTACPP
jgi:hypothetical protein